MDKVVLMDGMNAIHRANVSFGAKKSAPEWNATSLDPAPEQSQDFVLVFNFFRNLRPLVEMFAPDSMFMVMEGHPQFRYDLFSDYKANRLIKQAAKQDDKSKVHAAADEIVRLLQYLPITVARAQHYEADDTIGTLCHNMREEDLTVISNDSDYIQLLQRGYHSLTIYNPIKKVVMEAPEYPFIAWKSLAGDKADSIPALLKPKKALQTVNDPRLFQTFLSVEENRANFNINRQLIEFHPVPEEEIILQQGTRDYSALKQEFARMDFQSLINPDSWHKFTTTFDCLRH